jgi:AAA domain, putative AbiEii toxin, Type IV TA system/SIR2-like domain
MSTSIIPLADPRPPDVLIDACVAGECVVYAGAGLSARAGFPTYGSFLEGLLEWATEEKLIGEEEASIYGAGIENSDFSAAADGMVNDLRVHGTALNTYLEQLFLRSAELSDAHRVLSDLPFGAALTTNWDTLVEQTFATRSGGLYTPRDAEQLLDALHKRGFFVIKLYGDLSRSETLMISPSQFGDAVRENIAFSRFMETLFFSKTILFIGASLEGIEDYLKGIALRKQTDGRQHFALVGLVGKGWRAKASWLEKRYGIHVLPYSPTDQHPEVVRFLNSLKDRIQTNLGHASKQESTARLQRVVLDNIGPFEKLDLTLNARWNILLGDNGVGKSVILKAIGAAICGKDAQPFAARLVQQGKTTAMITLQTDRNTYKTEILLAPNSPTEINSIPVRPLEAENWLALGFPPLRAGTWERPKSPDAYAVTLPVPDDLLPVVSGVPDPRLDKLKHWIVNLDYRSKDEQSRSGTSGRYEKLLNEFFQVVGELTGGVKIERGDVNPQTGEITVITDDGKVPIEAISQGATSLIGWVGILLQRLYEVYSADENPRQRYALVLMDEIDAHLHPAWQQSLVFALERIFPNVQFIATTHSPLIVGGMPSEQVVRFARDEEGKVVRLEVDADMTMGRTDQILTTSLFGLKTTLDKQTQEEVKQYRSLLGKSHRTPAQEREFQRLRGVVQFRIPPVSQTLEERRAAVREKETLLLRVEAQSVPPKQVPPKRSRRKSTS